MTSSDFEYTRRPPRMRSAAGGRLERNSGCKSDFVERRDETRGDKGKNKNRRR